MYVGYKRLAKTLFSSKTVCYSQTRSSQLCQSMYTKSLGAITAFLFDKTAATIHILELIYQYTTKNNIVSTLC